MTFDPDEIWLECYSIKYALIDGVRFSIRHNGVKIVPMTSFHTQNCCHLVSEHEASGQCQFLIYGTFLFIQQGMQDADFWLNYVILNCFC